MLNIIYAGTPEFAVPPLAALLASEHRVVAVYTQPDRPAGRGRKLQPGPVKRCALERDLPIFQPESLKSATEVQGLQALAADLMVVAAYGLLLPAAVLAAPRLGCVNIHASLLPRWRGASPIQQAILAGDRHSGVTLMKMDQGLDTGDMIMSRSLAIEPGWSAADLHDRLAPLGAELLLEALCDITALIAQARPQDESAATYAPRLEKQQARIDWRKPALELQREVAAYNPWPVSFTERDGDNLRIWSARVGHGFEASAPGEIVAHDTDGLFVSCGEGVLQVTEMQFSGRKRSTAAEVLNGACLNGCRLGSG